MKKINKFLGLAILVLAILPMVSAATTMTVPISGGNYSTTLLLAITVDANGVNNMTNITCAYNSTGGSAEVGEATQLATILNTTADQTSFVSSVTISSFTELATYNISCEVSNFTTGGVSTLNTTLYASGVAMDNTAPVMQLLVPLDKDSENYDRAVEYRCSIADAIDSSASFDFSVAHPTGDTTTSTTLLTSTSLTRFTDTDYPGDYVFSCSSTDSAGNAITETATVTIDKLGRIIGVTRDSGLGSNYLLWAIVAVLVIYLITKKK